MDEDVGARREPSGVGGHADVALELLDPAREPCVVERDEVESADLMAVGDEPTREMEAEEAGAAGDRHAHRRKVPAARARAGRLRAR